MKRLLLITLTFNLIASSLVAASNKGETRTAQVNIKLSPTDDIFISAKYTALEIETWDKNEVEVIASVRFDGKMTDKMNKFLKEFENEVKNKIKLSNGKLTIDTNLDEPNKVQIGSRVIGISIGFGEDELKLDYKIKAPATNSYEITSSYRDVRLIGSFKSMKIEQYSGELIGDEIESADFNLKYGSASFKEIKTAKMELYEQKMSVETFGNLSINAKYSDLQFDQLQTMKSEAYESNFTIGSAQTIEGEFKYGEIEISNNLAKGKFTLYETDIEANSIDDMVFISSKYSKLNARKMNAVIFEESYEDETEFGSLGTFKSLNSKYGKHTIGELVGSFELNAYEDDLTIKKIHPTATNIGIEGKYIKATIDTYDLSYNLTGKVKYGKVSYSESAVNVRKYIKESDELEIALESKKRNGNPLNMKMNGYEIDIYLK